MSRLNNDDDLAPLIPSKSSSFNLVDDAENLRNSRKSSGSGGLSNHHNRKRSNEQDESAYFHRRGPARLSTIVGSSSFQSVESKHTNKSHTSRSGRSSSRRKKLKREEKRRQWLKRWRRRRLIGTITLSFIYTLLGAYTILVTAGPLILQYWIDPMDWCPTYPEEFGEENLLLQKTSKDIHEEDDVEDKGKSSSKYENPDYNDSPCHITRIPLLLHLTLEECDLSRRMFTSVLLGGLVGYERRASDRPAGIRTMALVSLGSCFFTISSMLAFRASPMNWDSSRVSAAIPSGVGFLGAGLIWKGTLKDGSGAEVHQVHGITTAASVWLSAAIGVGAGGALYAVSAYSTALVILVLRFGPRLYLASDKGFEDEEEESDEEEDEIDYDYDHNQEPHEVRNNSEVDNNATQHSPSYEMQLRQDTEALKRDEKDSYGATSMEVDSVAHLLMQEQQRQIERLSSHRQALDNDIGEGARTPFFGWLGNLISGNTKDRQQPHNPYREIYKDREVMKMIKKKKSLSTIKSRPSFCT
jgi:putative Mg2+ transporter-C (MgtC) family protein